MFTMLFMSGLAQSAWQDANRLVDALGSWRAYLKKRTHPETIPKFQAPKRCSSQSCLSFPASTVERVAQLQVDE